MTKKRLHPSVEQFKEFVKKNPKIMDEVKSGQLTLQEVYEEWYLLGEDDSRWDQYRTEEETGKTNDETKTEWLPTFMKSIKNMDPNQVQGYLSNISNALGAIQGILTQFQASNTQNPGSSSQSGASRQGPFSFRKD
jgi:hypothetical protein